MDILIATVLTTTFVLLTLLFRQPGAASNRLAVKGRQIEWDRPGETFRAACDER